ncbi:MAG: hypothetical protein GC134_05910 [Proteobacteria bacterium]|nr:hypothetical protein [Pseudomonadota bacterium]
MTLPTPITDLTLLKAVNARFSVRVDAETRRRFAIAIKTAEMHGLPTDDLVFNTIIAASQEDLNLKMFMRLAALLQDFPANADIKDLNKAIQPFKLLLEEVTIMMLVATIDNLDWPITIKLEYAA